MIKHIVMWKLKDEVEGKTKNEIAVLLKEELENMRNTVPEIVKIEAGININHGPIAYDLCLYSEFKSEDDLASYQDNMEHKKVKDLIVKYAENGVVVDYEI
jgi:hypothetical protein